jgi:hypothetical protein
VPEDIFEKRGIPEEIWKARPYTPWKTDDLTPVRSAYGGLGKAGLAFALRIAEQSPGYLINRFPPEGLGLDPIYPEFRPDNAVITDDRPHRHLHLRDGMSPQKGIVPARFVISGKSLRYHVNHGAIRYLLYDAAAGPLSGADEARVTAALAAAAEAALRKVSNDSRQDNLIEQIKALSLGVGRPGVAVYGPVGEQQNIRTPPGQVVTEHCGMDCWYVHEHVSWAKYVFPIGDKVDETRWHDHHAIWHDHEGRSDKWIAKHVAKQHFGSEAAWHGQEHRHPNSYDVVLGQRALARWHKLAVHIKYEHEGSDLDTEGLHPHTWRVKDRSLNLARRLDVHPEAMKKIPTAEVVFFVIEGCLKADSILAKGAAVFSVPSVSLWDCKELKRFAETYLKDKEVVIVPDADWIDNREVVSQARLCHATLIRYGVARVHVAAPPVNWSGYPYRGKGVDDFLGIEGHGELEELQTLDHVLLPATKMAIDRLLERCTRSDQYSRNRDVIESMAIYAGPTGELPSSLGMVGRAMGLDGERVREAVGQFMAWGALSCEDGGDLSSRRGYWTGELEWSETPVIIIAEQYRAQRDEPHQLCDVVSGRIITNGGS